MEKENITSIPTWMLCLASFIAGILLVAGLKGCEDRIDRIDPRTTYHKTDTVYLAGYKIDTFAHSSPTPPKTVTKYIHDTLEVGVAVAETSYVRIPGDTTYYPVVITEDGLVAAKFSKDSLTLDLWATHDTAQSLKTLYYPVNYDRYNYEWVNGELKQQEKPKFKKLNKMTFYTESYAYFAYNPFNKNTSIALDYSMMYKKVGIFSRGTLGLKNTGLDLGLKIKLK